jgi:protein-disulfide isomerase
MTKLPSLADCVLVVGAASVLAFAGIQYLPRDEGAGGSLTVHRIHDHHRVSGVGRVLGSSTALVKIVEFADYQCPYCAAAQPRIDSLLKMYPLELAVLVRHFPLRNLHPQAFDAAMAVECAAAQGRFESMHHVLYDQQSLVVREEWGALGKDADVADTSALVKCVESKRYAASILADVNAGESLGVTATPSIVLGDSLYVGIPERRVLDRMIRGRLERLRSEGNRNNRSQ